MTALTASNTHFIQALPANAPQQIKSTSLEYCNITASEQAHAKLRDLTALESMYAYFGSDEASR
ncbi:MAG: hypothetical protein ACK4VZ_00665 [Paracoccaceae bacterium]